MKTLADKLKDIDQLDAFVDLVGDYSRDLAGRGMVRSVVLTPSQRLEIGTYDTSLGMDAWDIIKEAERHYELELENKRQRATAQLCQMYGDTDCEACG